MRYLLDTCVISELIARKPNAHVVQWVDGIADEKIYLSVITIGEIQKGIEKLPDSRHKSDLSAWLEDELMARFHGRILGIDVNTMLTWGRLTERLELKGRKMPAIDSLIAAIAIHGRLNLVTRNEKDFEHAGVQIINPWR